MYMSSRCICMTWKICHRKQRKKGTPSVIFFCCEVFVKHKLKKLKNASLMTTTTPHTHTNVPFGLGSRLQGLGFRVQVPFGLGFRVQGLGTFWTRRRQCSLIFRHPTKEYLNQRQLKASRPYPRIYPIYPALRARFLTSADALSNAALCVCVCVRVYQKNIQACSLVSFTALTP